MEVVTGSIMEPVPQGWQKKPKKEEFDEQAILLQAQADIVAQGCLDRRITKDTVQSRAIPMALGWLVFSELVSYTNQTEGRTPQSGTFWNALVLTTDGKLCSGSPVGGKDKVLTIMGPKHVLRHIPGMAVVKTVVTEPNPSFSTTPRRDLDFYQDRLASFAKRHKLPGLV